MPLISLLASFVASAGLTASAPGEPSDPRIDPDSARQIAAWTPSRPFDHLDMTLELTIPSMAEAKLLGRETLTVMATGSPRRVLPLACNGPVITAVRPLTF